MFISRTMYPIRWLRLFARRFLHTVYRADCLMVAAALTYTTLLALVPLLTITVLVFHNFPAFEKVGESLEEFLSANLLPEAVSRLVTLYSREFIANSTRLSMIGTVMLIVTALILLSTIESAFNRIWRVRRARTLGARLVTYWFVLTAGPLLFGIGVYLTTQLAKESLKLTGHVGLATPLVSFFLIWGFFWALYQLVPHRPVRSRDALLAAFITTGAFLFLQRGFAIFIARFATYDLVYGAFAALPIFLVWIYLLWTIILLGAALAATLGALSSSRLRPDTLEPDSASAQTDEAGDQSSMKGSTSN